MPVTTSIVINFTDNQGGDQSSISAEVDSREDGYNQGRTSFAPGDSPVFLVFRTSDVTITSVESTSGSCVPIGTGFLSVEELLTFANSDQASLRYPPSSPPTITRLSGNGSFSALGSTIRAAANALAVVRVVYQAAFTAYRLSGVPASLGGLTSFPVVILVSGNN